MRSSLWRKAAVLGSLWAASEIVLGSFLKNTRVPLSGQVLTGIGVALLTAGHRLWPERGLFWRAGLICAAMKSVSPSAVILTPMIAISVEGFLMEAGVRLAGINALGYLLGGGLAMSWALVHKAGKFYFLYGPDSLAFYSWAWEKLRGWLGLAPRGLWPPFLALLAGHFAGGAAAAAAGLRLARSKPGRVAPASPAPAVPAVVPPGPAPAGERFSLAALALHAAFIAALMSAGARLSLPTLAGSSALYAALCLPLYPRAARVMGRPSLWCGILCASALAGLVLGRWQAGVIMTLRAAVLTVGFCCIGHELRGPKVRAWLERRAGRVFFDALEQAFETLPLVLSGLPSGRELLRDPLRSVRAAIARAPGLYESLSGGRVLLITGQRAEGKSTLVRSLAEALRAAGRSVGGLHAPGLWEEDRRAGFDIVDLSSGERKALCRAGGPEDWPAAGKFRFSPDGLSFGLKALAEARLRDPDVVLVDEVGPLELEGGGWAAELDALRRGRRKPMVWAVRGSLVDEVQRRWGLPEATIVEAGKTTAEELVERLRETG